MTLPYRTRRVLRGIGIAALFLALLLILIWMVWLLWLELLLITVSIPGAFTTKTVALICWMMKLSLVRVNRVSSAVVS